MGTDFGSDGWSQAHAEQVAELAAARVRSPRPGVASLCAIVLIRSLPAEQYCEKMLNISVVAHARRLLPRIASMEVLTEDDLVPFTSEDGPIGSALGSVPDYGLDPQAAARSFVLDFWSWVVELGFWSLGRGKAVFVSDAMGFSLESIMMAASLWGSNPGDGVAPTVDDVRSSIVSETALLVDALRIESFSRSDARRLLAMPLSPVVQRLASTL
jgi:hypothetical protein